MALNQYCSPDEVRAALGLNSRELGDEVLGLPIYEIDLLRDLSRVAQALPGAFLTLLALPPASRTDAAKALIDAVRLFSAYSVARHVGASVGLLVAKSIGDGEATTTRFSDAPYKDTLDRVERLWSRSRADLLSAYEASGGVAASAPVAPFYGVLASRRGVDPVTGA